MKCEFCDNTATVHLKQLLEDESIEMDLCETCAEERGITDPDGFSLASLLGDKDEQVKNLEFKDLPECSHCGFSFQDLKKVGRLGCSECYNVFDKEILGMLSSMHRGIEHTGKSPQGMFLKLEKQEALESAKQELQSAIDAEDFEKAVRLRDTIKKLEESAEQ